ncbi:MAG: hypothetical protein ACLFVD_01280 [Dehalococcoidia bacterium]
MKKKALVCIVLSFVFLGLALFSYFYESRSTGLLPVITHPLRDRTIPLATVAAVLAACAIFIQGSGRR